ncbi:hypothetical protein PILCRDRAFT_10616 [Piloderma croceum F 1598]|uniref:DUF659 domain-containing protein n=1 Tax=Piloderma croceum (strain F 1598) TaxID=765440 RepID=A0A0C3FHE8_PILCF|nr:hypothetical protein PILCRDRAFT_10616 [Piloderma croceum F 1598]
MATRDRLAMQLREAITVEHESAKQLLAVANTAWPKLERTKEREAAQRHTAVAQMSKMSEDGLRAQLGQLTAKFIDAERYRAAYYSLVDEVGASVKDSPETWEVQSALFGFTKLNNVHNGKRMSGALFKIIERLGITRKIGFVTCDNASNNDAMMSFSRST